MQQYGIDKLRDQINSSTAVDIVNRFCGRSSFTSFGDEIVISFHNYTLYIGNFLFLKSFTSFIK